MFRVSLFLFIFSIIANVSWSQNSDFNATIDSQCPGNLFTLTADDNSLASYSWTVTLQGGGASSSYNVNPVAFVLDNSGLYDVSLTVSDVAGTSTTTELGFLEVYSNPTVDYTVSAGPYCAPATTDFTSISTAGSGAIVSYVAFTDGTPYSTADFQHTYSSIGTYSVNVSIENSFGCVASGDLADIVVTDFPSLTSPLNPNTICSGSVFNYTPTSTISGSTFSWVRAVNPDIAEVPSNGVGAISEMLTSTSGSNVPVTYAVTNTSPGGCVNTQNVVLTVQPLPSVTIDDIDICTGQSGTLTATPSQGGGVYSWSTSATTQSISVTTSGVYSVSYSVGSCASAPADALVTETAPPSITGITIVENSGLLPDDGVMCKGADVVTLTASASSGTGTFSWTPSGSGNSIDVSPNSTTTYTVVYTDGGCSSAPFSQTIIVFSAPTNNFSSTITNSCNSPVTTDYTSTSSGTIVWSFAGGTPATGAGSGPIPVTYNSSGVYGITMQNTSAQGCVTVSDFPTAIVIGNGFPPTSSFSNTTPDVQCIEGNSFCFDYTGFGADTCQWDFGDGSPLELHDQNAVICHAYSSLGSFTVTMIPFTTVGSALGCSGIGSTLTIELTGPISAFSVSPLVCEDQLTRTYTSTSTGVSGTTQYTWDLESPTIQVTGVTSTTHTFSDYSPNFASPYIITLTVEDAATGCPPSISTQNILAYPNDQANFESYTDISQATPSSEVCLGDVLVFYNTTPLPQNTNPSTNSQDTQWDWTIDNGLQWFTSSEYRGSPEDLLYSPTALTTSGNVPWVPGVYTVSMRNGANNNGTYCYDTVAKQITVHGIIGDFTVPDTVCVDQVFDVVDNSTAPLTSIVSREWDWESDGVVDLSGNISTTVHSFSIPGVYNISMTAEDEFGCPKTVTQTIVVREVIASFSIDRDFICNDQDIAITNNNSISFGASSYQWIANTALSPAIPGTSSDFNPGSFLFDEQGVGSISLTVTDNLGCTDDTTISITVFDVFAAATGSPNSSSCFNPPTVVTFTNLSGNNVDATSYEWDFGNGETSTDESPSTIYSLPGMFDVTLIVQSLTGGCADTAIVETINIGGPFGSIAVTNPVLEGCSCYAADIDVTTSDVAEATLLYGDGSFENITINSTETITHQYCNSGTTSQSLTPILFISSGTCNGNILSLETITIHPNPNVVNPGNFEYCEGENIAEIPLIGSVPGTTYNWENDNITIGLDANGAGDIASFTAETPGGPDNVANIIVTPLIAATGCSGAAESFSLTVKNTTIADAGSAIVVCAGSDVPLNGSFGGGATSASWTTTGTGIFDNANSLTATYTPSVDDINAGAVTLTLTTDDPVGPCPANSSDVIVTINAAVTVNAGPDATICSDDTFTTSATIGGSASSGEWNTSGTGLFISASDPITVYVPSVADFLAGSVQLTLSTDDPGGPCSQSSSTMTLTFSDAATLTVDTPLESCVGTTVDVNAVIGGSASGLTWSTSGSGVFSDVNNLNPSYSPSNTENLGGQAIVTATVSDPDGAGPCLALTEDVLITLLDTVTVSAGNNAVICSNNTYTLDGAIGGSASSAIWTSNGTGVFDDDNDLLTIYNPSTGDLSTGSVILTLTTDDPTGPCGQNSSSMTLSFSPVATLTVPATLTSCLGTTVSLSAVIGGSASGIIWSTTDSGLFSPSINDLTPDYTPSNTENAAGQAIVMATVLDPDGVGPCLTLNENIVITLLDTVTVSAGDNAVICSNDIYTLDGAIGGSAISSIWTSNGTGVFDDDNDLLTNYTPSLDDLLAGSVILTLTTDDPVGPCNASTDDMELSFSTAATIDIAGTTAGTCDNSAVPVSATLGGSASSLTWSGGSGTYTPSIFDLDIDYSPSAGEIATGTLVLTATTDDPDGTGPCQTAFDNVTINIATDVFVDPGTDQEACSDAGIQLNGVIGGAASSAEWTGGLGTFFPNVSNLDAVYTPTATEIANGSVTLTLTTDDPVGPCIAASAQVTYTFTFPATVSAGADEVVCSNSSIALSGSIGGTASTGTWVVGPGSGSISNVNSLGAVYTPSNDDMLAGVVTLTLTTDNPAGACPAVSSSMNVIINEAASISVISPLVECVGDEFQLTAVMGGSASSVTWSNGLGIFTNNINELSPTYLPTVAENNSSPILLELTSDDPDGSGPCLAAVEQVVLQIDAAATVSAGSNDVVCSNSDIDLNGSTGGLASASQWTTSGSGTFSNINSLVSDYTPSNADMLAGVVTLTLTTDDPVGACPAVSSSMNLIINEAASLSVISPLVECIGDEFQLTAVMGGSASSVTWSNGLGIFTNNINELTPTYLPTVAENNSSPILLELTSDDPDGSGPCLAAVEQVVLQIDAAATVSAGSNDVVCSNSDLSLNGTIGGLASSSEWSTSGTGTFSNFNSLVSDYTPSNADMLAGVVTLTLTSDDPAGACPAVSSSMNLIINEAASLTVVTPVEACVNNEIALESIIGGSATSATWTNGLGTFTDNINDLTPLYLPTALENTNGGLTLDVTTDDPDGSGPCPAVSEQVVIQINDLPTVFAGIAIDVCSNNQVLLNGTFGGAASSASWSSTGGGVFGDIATLNTEYTPDATDLVNGTVTLTLTTDDPIGPCLAVSSDVIITFIELPTSNAGLNQDVCSDQVVDLSGTIGGSATVGTWSTAGTGDFLANELDLNGQYQPSAADIGTGSVLLTLTTNDPSGVCGLVSSEMTINLFGFAVADAGVNQSICSAEDAILGGTIGGSATSITWSTSGDGIFTSTLALNATYEPGTNDQNSGFVTLTMTTNDPVGPCPSASSDITISISGVAEVDAGSNFTVCAGADVALNGSISGAVITGQWSGGDGVFSDVNDLGAIYTPTPAELGIGNVVLTLTSEDPVGPCGPEFADVTVSFTSSAIVSAGPPQTICEGDEVSLNGVVGGSSVTGQWTLTDGLFIPDVNNLNAIYIPSATDIINGSVELILTTNDPAGPCSAASDTILITINPSPVLSSSASIDVCSGNPVDYPITSNVSSTFTWVAQFDNTAVDGESLTAQNSSGIDDVLINTSVDLQTVSYFISATAIGTGCVNENQLVSVNISPVVTMDTPDNQLHCVGEDTDNVFFSSSFLGVSYQWTNDNLQIGLAASGSTDILSFPAVNNTAIIQTGVISVTPIIDGCEGVSVNFEITVNPSSTVNDPGAISECDGAPTSDIIFTGSDPAIVYNWTNTNPAIGIPVVGIGNILSFTATNITNAPIQATIEVTPVLNGCLGESQTFTISVDPSPEMVIPTDQTICVTNNSSPVIFTSNVVGTSYDWINDNESVGLIGFGVGDIPVFTTINNGNELDTANITVTPVFNGCSGTPIEFDFIVTPILEVSTIQDTILCAGEDFSGVLFTGNVPNATYEWQNDNISIDLAANGSGDIPNFIVTNSGTVNQVATITVTPILPGCGGLDTQFTITVKPVPTVSTVPLTQTLCHDESTTPIDFSGNIVDAVYDWTNDDVSIGIGSPGFGDIPSFTATNTSLVTETGTFNVTPSYNGCVGESESFTITVNPRPSVFPIPSQVLCADFPIVPVDFDGDFGDVATYTWTNDNVLIGLPDNGVGDINTFIVQNTTSVVQTATITVLPSLNGCQGLPQVFTITVKPTPTLVGPIADQSLCVNTDSDPVIFTGNLPSITNYNWINDNVAIGLAAGGVGNIASFTALNTGNTVIISTITVTPELNGCLGIPQQFTITTVDPVPVVFDPLDQVVCAGLLTNTVAFIGPNPTTSFIWTNDNLSIGLGANGTGDIIAFASENTSLVDQEATLSVVPEFNGCLGASQTFSIIVKPTPNVVITPVDQELCSGETTSEIDFSGDLVGTTYDWVNDNVSINLIAGSSGNIPGFISGNLSATVQVATVSVTPTFNGCVGATEDAIITVNPISTVIIAPGVDEYCHNEPSLDYIFNSSNPATQYNWTNDNTSIGLPSSGVGNILSFPVSNTDLINQLATITVQPELNGCDGAAQVVQILVKPIPTVDQVDNQNICANENSAAIIFDGNMTDSTEFNWTHDNVSIGLNSNSVGNIPSFVGNNISQDIEVGNITVTPILNGCIGTAMTTSITVNPISIVNTINDTVCSGVVVPQIDFIGSNVNAVYTWSNDNSSIGLPNNGNDFIPYFTSENLGTTTQIATIIVTPSVNGCPGINDTMEIVVYPLPIVDPIADGVYCSGDLSDAINFTGNMGSNQYNWSNDNAAIGLAGAAIGNIPSFVTTNTGTADLIGTIVVTPIANECLGAEEFFTITVHPLPDVEAGSDTTLCFEQSITLTATGANNYAWDYGVINGVELFPSSTILYHVVGTDTNLCQNTDSILVTYTLDLPPVVNAGLDTAICIGEDMLLAASGDAILYLWNNGVTDGEVFVPVITNEYVVIGTAANGCVESDTVVVVVNPLPVITAFASDDFICDGESTILWGEGADIYVWDQSVVDSIAFVPSVTSTYTVVGFDVNGCTDTTEIEVIVNPLPDVLFSTNITYGGCLPFEPLFTDLTDGPESNSVMWYFGNGASSDQMGSVINTYDSYGCYDITLVSTTSEGCTDSLTQQNFVCVNEVNAEFQPDVFEQSVVNPIFEFTNSSTNATSFEWFFGDGAESDFVNTTHFYDSYGNYLVALVAMTDDGCTDTAYVAITVVDEVLFYVPNSFTPNGDGQNDIFIPVLTAGYDRGRGYEFSIYNRWGERVYFTDTPGEGWDATFNNKMVQNGSYIWYVKFKDSMNNDVYDYKGHVNVIK